MVQKDRVGGVKIPNRLVKNPLQTPLLPVLVDICFHSSPQLFCQNKQQIVHLLFLRLFSYL